MATKPVYMKSKYNSTENVRKVIKRINFHRREMQKKGLDETKYYEKIDNPFPDIYYTKSGAISTKAENIEKIMSDKSSMALLYRLDKIKTNKVYKQLVKDIEDYNKNAREPLEINKETLTKFGKAFKNLHDTIMNNLSAIYKNATLTEALHRPGQLTAKEADELEDWVEQFSKFKPIKYGLVKKDPRINNTGNFK